MCFVLHLALFLQEIKNRTKMGFLQNQFSATTHIVGIKDLIIYLNKYRKYYYYTHWGASVFV